MPSTILLNTRLEKSWTSEGRISKAGKKTENENIKALNKLGISNIDEYHNLIISKLNSVNSKLAVDKIEFTELPIESVNRAINAGVIVEKNNDACIPLAYVFISNPHLGSRNIFGAQQLFPGLSYLIEKYMDSPSFDLVNLPVYFINASTDKVTESMFETIMALSMMGIRYIQIFNEESLPASLVDKNLISFSRRIATSIDGSRIKTDYYEIDTTNKIITFTTDYLEKNPDSFGSSDRFYIMKAYPALISADLENYTVDIDKVKLFNSRFRKGCNNIEPFIKYATKLLERKRV